MENESVKESQIYRVKVLVTSYFILKLVNENVPHNLFEHSAKSGNPNFVWDKKEKVSDEAICEAPMLY